MKNKVYKPTVAVRLLAFLLLPKSYREILVGDMSEMYPTLKTRFGTLGAHIRIVRQMLLSAWPIMTIVATDLLFRRTILAGFGLLSGLNNIKESSHFARIGMGIAAFMLLIFPTMITNYAAGSPFQPHATKMPISERCITLQVTFDDGEGVKSTKHEGGMIRVEYAKYGLILGLTPLITTDENVQVKIFIIHPIESKGKPMGEALSELDTVALDRQEARVSRDFLNFSIKLVNVESCERFINCGYCPAEY